MHSAIAETKPQGMAIVQRAEDVGKSKCLIVIVRIGPIA
jgi:hypothetical protein